LAQTEFRYDCPHCLTLGAGFSIKTVWTQRGNPYLSNIAAACGVCSRGIIVEAKSGSGHFPTDLVNRSIDFPTNNLVIQRAHPKTELDIPTDLPPSVEKFLRQGMVNLHGGNWDAAGAMFRKTLDVSTKIIVPKQRGLYT